MGMYNREDNLRAMGFDPWAEPPPPQPEAQKIDWQPWLIVAAAVLLIGATLVGWLYYAH